MVVSTTPLEFAIYNSGKSGLDFPYTAERSFPVGQTALIAFACFLVRHQRTFNFDNSRLFITDANIWSEELDQIGQNIFKKLSGSNDFPNDVLFQSPEDNDNLLAMISIILIFQWDAIIVSAKKEFAVQFSHDQFMRVFASDKAKHQSFLMLLDKWIG